MTKLRPKNNRGASLLEVVSAIIMLGIAIPPLVGLFTEVSTRSVDHIYQDFAVVYAEALMEEIVSKKYEDPDLSKNSFGREEKSRSAYDDVDDFDGLDNSPPIHLDGTSLVDLQGFRRSVLVDSVTSSDPDPKKAANDGSTDLKRIRVTVAWSTGSGGELTLTTLRGRVAEADSQSGPLDEIKSAATAKRKSSRSLQLDLISIAASDSTIESFQLSADASAAAKKMKLHHKTIWEKKSGLKLPLAETSLNKGSSSQRTIKASATRKMEIEFKDRPKGAVAYQLVLNFTDGRSASMNFSVLWH